MKGFKFPLLVASLSVLMIGCQEETQFDNDFVLMDEVTQKDVYKTLDECMADWQDASICAPLSEQEVAEQNKQLQQFHQSNSGTFVPIIMGSFHGPEYSTGTRSIIHNGKVYTPTKHSYMTSTRPGMATPGYMTAKSSYLKANPQARQMFPHSVSKPQSFSAKSTSGSVRRGGFGSTGRAGGGFGGG
jgi:hypothetical protein